MALCAVHVLLLAWAVQITVLDVGQGLSILVQAPSGQTLLYDAGPASGDVAAQLRSLGIERIDLVVASHNHDDHIGGLVDVFAQFPVNFYIDNAFEHTTRTYERVWEAFLETGAQLLEPNMRTINLGDVRLTVVPPMGDQSLDQNNNIVGIRLDYGAFSAFFPGDAEEAQWRAWLRDFPDVLSPVTLHQASHHGSKQGDIPQTIGALRPEIVVIGVGLDNSYKHPHEEALLMYSGLPVYRTDLHGRIVITGKQDGSYTVEYETGTLEVAEGIPYFPGCVNINTASFEELQLIKQIGPDRAQQVIDLRAIFPFRTVESLRRVSGIGPVRMEQIFEEGIACVFVE